MSYPHRLSVSSRRNQLNRTTSSTSTPPSSPAHYPAHQDELALSFAEEPALPPGFSRSASSNSSFTLADQLPTASTLGGGSGATAQLTGGNNDEFHPMLGPSARRGGTDFVTRRPPASRSSSAPKRTIAPPNQSSERGENELFFDAGEAMGESAALAATPSGDAQQQNTVTASPTAELSGEMLPTYDFERQTYFNNCSTPPSASASATPTRSRSRRASSSARRPSSAGGHGREDSENAEENEGLLAGAGVTTGPSSSLPHSASPSSTRRASQNGEMHDGPDPSMNNLGRARMLLGRFGRFVGMRVPGAVYSSVSQHDGEDGTPGSIGGGGAQGAGGAGANASYSAAPHRNRRVMGGGLGQDGVFANLNAKPDRRRRRRRGTGGADGQDSADRGEDDDLEDDALPPTYETAAADAAPPYWETTIIGGPGSLHPLAPGGLGWTPGSPVIGAIEDLILEGLPVGNLFGLAWNLLVSTSFQFVGFLLTYLLHTTHAARAGSWAGLGITLVQYGYYLRTAPERAAEQQHAGSGMSHADQLAHDGDHTPPPLPHAPTNNGNSSDSNSGDSSAAGTTTTKNETLAFILMVLGYFILLSSLVNYFRTYRWGYQLVATARREQADAEAAMATADGGNGEGGSGATDGTNAHGTSGGGMNVISRVRNFFSSGPSDRAPAASSGGSAAMMWSDLNPGVSRPHDAENYIIFPTIGFQLNGLSDLESPHHQHHIVGRSEGEHLSPEEARLLSNLRSVGLTA